MRFPSNLLEFSRRDDSSFKKVRHFSQGSFSFLPSMEKYVHEFRTFNGISEYVNLIIFGETRGETKEYSMRILHHDPDSLVEQTNKLTIEQYLRTKFFEFEYN